MFSVLVQWQYIELNRRYICANFEYIFGMKLIYVNEQSREYQNLNTIILCIILYIYYIKTILKYRAENIKNK